MPVPVHKYPKQLVDLILDEYAGICFHIPI